MPKRTTAADRTPLRVVIVTLDQHLVSAAARARAALAGELPQLELAVHGATEWGADPAALDACLAAIGQADLLVVTMLFMDEHIHAVLPALAARREQCDALVACMSGERVTRLTKLGKLSFDGFAGSLFGLLRKLRPKTAGQSGAAQLAALRRLPRLLRAIPGRAQDMRNYFLVLLYWLAGSERNLTNLVRLLVARYAAGPRAAARAAVREVEPPVEYPDVGLYHPRLRGGIGTDRTALPRLANARGTVGVLVMRSYVLAGNTHHYDSVIGALEAKGLNVVPAFASGLDARSAIERYFVENGRACIDALVSLTGFSLVGGPAFNDAAAAAATLQKLDVPYLAAHAVEFQSLTAWQRSELGLTPLEATLMVAIPELDGSTGPMVIGGRGARDGHASAHDMRGDIERAEMLAARVARLVELRSRPRAERKLAITLFNFPPNAGNVGTAAYLAVFESLFNVLTELERAGYRVERPASVAALRDAILGGNSGRFGTPANVHARIEVDDYVRREPWLDAIEAQWGPAPGRQQTDGATLFVLGARFGNVLVGLQPSFGYEGDPIRLLFERGFAPTHAFSAFYRYLREDFAADAVLHFGTHGSLEFMPGKQCGLGRDCWPDRLLRDLPNIYLYAANNPSEATIAKRRSAATLVSYLTPPVVAAGLHRDLAELKELIDRHRSLPPAAGAEQGRLEGVITERAAALELLPSATSVTEPDAMAKLAERLRELEYTLIPQGLHVLGEPMTPSARATVIGALAAEQPDLAADGELVAAIVAGATVEQLARDSGTATASRNALERLVQVNRQLMSNGELAGLVHALDGGFVPPAPSGDLLRAPEILPTGRNPHGFDPFKLPSLFAVREGHRHAEQLLALAPSGTLPESVAVVLWGSDNLKSEGVTIGLALALLGAEPRRDAYGRLSGAKLVPLAELGRPRIDVVVTLSGIFRDLLPLQTAMLAEAAYLAAAADEPAERNFVRKHALAYAAEHGCDLETAALRVFSNAAGAYGANVNHLVENGRWENDDELGNTYAQRKSFAYSRKGKAAQQRPLLEKLLGNVSLAYQSLESVEIGVTSLDQYFDTLGGISRVAKAARGETLPIFIGDQTRGECRIRPLAEQITLESHTRLLNPTWYEGLLEHGYEGVRQIQTHVTNTFGWSATSEQVAPWVYDQIAATYVTDEAMRARLAALNPTATAAIAARLREAHERAFWSPDAATLEALGRAEDEIEDRLEGIHVEVAA